MQNLKFCKGQNFTLVELIAVLAVLGILISLLLPALQDARQLGIQTVCLNNTKSWGTGSIMYHKQNQKFWDINNYPYRSSGKRGNTGWGRPEVTERPVNEYLGYKTNGVEVPAALCPNDTYWRVDKDASTYDTLGTSYCDNLASNTIGKRGGNGHKSLRGLNVAKVVNPSTCLLFMEWPIVSQSYRPNEDFPSWHFKQQYFNVTMVDGSAKFIKILVGQVIGDNFNFEYDR
ncbi:MAG: type II secretion system GspH family protein [Lentisphaerales bacterium]|nr:type II secretion system GspH family protein [Lentisphaerales bacterium]